MSSLERLGAEPDPRHDPRPDMAARLTKREREVVTLISRGLTNQEIAEALYLSINSVKTYIRAAYRRLEVTNRSQAVIWGVRNEMLLAELEEGDRRPALAMV